MKKLLLISIFFFFTSPMFSQNYRIGSSMNYGSHNIVMNNNESAADPFTHTSTRRETSDGRLGFGISGEVNLSNRFSLELGLLKQNKGYKAERPFNDFEEQFSYLQIPITGKFYLNNIGEPINFYLGAGLFYANIQDVERKFSGNNEATTTTHIYEENDFGFQMQGGAEFIIKDKFVISPSFGSSMGFSDIYNEDAEIDSEQAIRHVNNVNTGLTLKMIF